MNIVIISSSIRTGRNSHRVALFFEKFLNNTTPGTATVLDLKEYNFPLFDERLAHQPEPSPQTLEFAEKVKNADGIIIVTPEYNGSLPASLKNVIDLLYAEWKKKPIAISTVSDGVFGGTQVITALLFTFWKIGALMVPSTFPVPSVDKNFDEQGNLLNPATFEKRAKGFVDELFWWIKARNSMNS
jgi:NAD(P)H-dependent FMN reductase